MELSNQTFQEDVENGFAMEALINDYHVALFFVSLASLVVGIPLVWNMLWHLKVRALSKKIFYSPRLLLCLRCV